MIGPEKKYTKSYGAFLKRLDDLSSASKPAAASDEDDSAVENEDLACILKSLSSDHPTPMPDVFDASGMEDVRTFARTMQEAADLGLVDVEGSRREGQRLYLTQMRRLFREKHAGTG